MRKSRDTSRFVTLRFDANYTKKRLKKLAYQADFERMMAETAERISESVGRLEDERIKRLQSMVSIPFEEIRKYKCS